MAKANLHKQQLKTGSHKREEYNRFTLAYEFGLSEKGFYKLPEDIRTGFFGAAQLDSSKFYVPKDEKAKELRAYCETNHIKTYDQS